MNNYISLLKYEHPVKKKWQDVFVKMRVHTQGYSPEKIFKSRRPNASLDLNELTYRKENFRAITKSLFDAAIDSYQECALLLDISISSDDAKEIENLKVYDGLKQMDLRKWWIKKPGAYRQTDPNSVVVVLPKHPTEKLIPSYEYEIPNFNNALNTKIDVDIRLIPTYNIVYLDKDSIIFKAGSWKYRVEKDKEYWEPYYFALDKEFTYLIYPVKEKNGFQYVQFQYYKNDLKVAPAVVVGGRLIIEEEEDDTLEYYIADLAGAAEWGDKCYGQDSDLQICETRFTYIEKWLVKKKCEQLGSEWYNGLHVCAGDHDTVCGTCKGSGWMADTSPMGTHLIDKGDMFNDQGNFIEPVGFIAPDSDILKHSADRTTHYYDKTQAELGIIKQNMTDQSGVSKAFDIAQKVTLVTNIVYDIYRGYEHLLNIIQGYQFRRSDITITLPEDFDVKNANDLGIELAEMKKNGASHNDLVEQNKRVMLKKYGDSEFNKWAQDVLAKYDKLYPYSLTEVRDAKAVFGSDLTANDINLHYFGYQILKDLFQESESIINSTDVLVALQERLKAYAPKVQTQIPDFA